MNKILQISIWIIVVALSAVILGFVNNSQKEILCKEIVVNIDPEGENGFINEADVKNLLMLTNDTGKFLLTHFDVRDIEDRINFDPSVKEVQAYTTIDGKLVLDVKQRKPIVRIYTNNESYYMDEGGYLMPLSQRYTARVLIIHGEINEPQKKRNQINFSSLNDSIKDKTFLDDIYMIASYIDKNKFWKAQIEQVYVNKELELELIPKVGNHKIVFGKVDNLESKFEKLMIFYKKGLSKTGWNEYSEINLKYKDQVVCTKRY